MASRKELLKSALLNIFTVNLGENFILDESHIKTAEALTTAIHNHISSAKVEITGLQATYQGKPVEFVSGTGKVKTDSSAG